MAIRQDLPAWNAPYGRVVSVRKSFIGFFPATWELKPGDILKYKSDFDLSGVLEIVEVESGQHQIPDQSSKSREDRVPGVRCRVMLVDKIPDHIRKEFENYKVTDDPG